MVIYMRSNNYVHIHSRNNLGKGAVPDPEAYPEVPPLMSEGASWARH